MRPTELRQPAVVCRLAGFHQFDRIRAATHTERAGKRNLVVADPIRVDDLGDNAFIFEFFDAPLWIPRAVRSPRFDELALEPFGDLSLELHIFLVPEAHALGEVPVEVVVVARFEIVAIVRRRWPGVVVRRDDGESLGHSHLLADLRGIFRLMYENKCPAEARQGVNAAAGTLPPLATRAQMQTSNLER